MLKKGTLPLKPHIRHVAEGVADYYPLNLKRTSNLLRQGQDKLATPNLDGAKPIYFLRRNCLAILRISTHAHKQVHSQIGNQSIILKTSTGLKSDMLYLSCTVI